jgi:SulP family sulfate permease
VNRMEFSVAFIAFLGVIIFGILKGVILAAVASIILLLRAVSDPHIAVLGRIPGTRRFTDINRHPDNELIPGVMIFRVEASLYYFNTDNIMKRIWTEIIGSEKSLKCVILDLGTSPYVDIAGAKIIKKLYLDLQAKGISFKIAEAHARVRDMLRVEDLEFLLGHISRKVTVDDLVNESTGNT